MVSCSSQTTEPPHPELETYLVTWSVNVTPGNDVHNEPAFWRPERVLCWNRIIAALGLGATRGRCGSDLHMLEGRESWTCQHSTIIARGHC